MSYSNSNNNTNTNNNDIINDDIINDDITNNDITNNDIINNDKICFNKKSDFIIELFNKMYSENTEVSIKYNKIFNKYFKINDYNNYYNKPQGIEIISNNGISNFTNFINKTNNPTNCNSTYLF